jgi:MFS family permease
MILASILFYVVGAIASGIAGFATAFGAGTGGGGTRFGSALAMQTTIAAFGLGISVVYTLMSVFGWYWFTEQDPGVGLKDKADKHRRIVRITAIANGICGIGGAIFGVLGIGYTQSLMTRGAAGPSGPAFSPAMYTLIALSMLLSLAVFVLWAVQIIASLNYMAWLASRVPDQPLREKALRYRWVLPLIFVVGYVCIGLGPIIALILYYNLINQMRIIVRNIRDQRGYGTSLIKPEVSTSM